MSSNEVLVPLITPLDERGRVCGASVRRLIAQTSASASGYIPCLTSGEGWLLDDEQWAAMLRHTLHEANGRPVIVGIERPTTTAVKACAARAYQLGASAVMFTTPFGADVGQEQMVDHYRAVNDHYPLDIYIYNESVLSGNETRLDTLLEIARLPHVVGIKDSPSAARTTNEISALRHAGLRYYIGWEQQLATAVAADGCVVSLANLEPALCRAALRCHDPALKQEVERLVRLYRLDAEDWYRHIKQVLVPRGIIATENTLEAIPELVR